jgi:hypothetical protein
MSHELERRVAIGLALGREIAPELARAGVGGCAVPIRFATRSAVTPIFNA